MKNETMFSNKKLNFNELVRFGQFVNCMLFGSPFLLPRVPISLENLGPNSGWACFPNVYRLCPWKSAGSSEWPLKFRWLVDQMLTFKMSTIDHNTYYYCSMFIIPTTGQNPNWNSPVQIAFFIIPTAKIQLIIIPTTDQNPNSNFPVQIAFFIIPTVKIPTKVNSQTQLKSPHGRDYDCRDSDCRDFETLPIFQVNWSNGPRTGSDFWLCRDYDS